MSKHTSEGHPLGQEIDDSPNPTHAAPAHEEHSRAGDVSGADADPEPLGSTTAGESESQRQSRDMLGQLQQMIDSVATQAGPVMREVAAKAAELAAVAGQKAGPIAHRAAEATERVGVRVAERGKVMASELRRTSGESAGETTAETTTETTAESDASSAPTSRSEQTPES